MHFWIQRRLTRKLLGAWTAFHCLSIDSYIYIYVAYSVKNKDDNKFYIFLQTAPMARQRSPKSLRFKDN